MNGTLLNWLKHAGIAVVVQLLFTLSTGSVVLAAAFAIWGYWWKEAGEFSVKHWDAPGRPWADFNPFSRLRNWDDRLDLIAPLIAVLLVYLCHWLFWGAN